MPYCEFCKQTVITIRPHPEHAPQYKAPVRVDVQPKPDGRIFILGREHGFMFAYLDGDDLRNARTASLPLFAEHKCK